MGEVIDEHQARLASITSCRCGEKSRTEVRRTEEARSELSYAEPMVQDASPAPIPSSAPVESIPPTTPEARRQVLRDLDQEDPDLLETIHNARMDAMQEERERELSEQAITPRSEAFFFGELRVSPEGGSGTLREIKDEEDVDKAEVLSLVLLVWLKTERKITECTICFQHQRGSSSLHLAV